MADEVKDDAHEEDVEGQVLKSSPSVRLVQGSAPGSDGEPKMTESDDDVEGQFFVKHRNS